MKAILPAIGSESIPLDEEERFEILIIEDSDVDAMILQEKLQIDGRFATSRVSRLDQGCELLRNGASLDALILDLNLPDSAGLADVQDHSRKVPPSADCHLDRGKR